MNKHPDLFWTTIANRMIHLGILLFFGALLWHGWVVFIYLGIGLVAVGWVILVVQILNW